MATNLRPEQECFLCLSAIVCSVVPVVFFCNPYLCARFRSTPCNFTREMLALLNYTLVLATDQSDAMIILSSDMRSLRGPDLQE